MSVISTPAAIIRETFAESVRVPIPEGAALLREVLTPKMAAYVTGVGSTKTVARWARGETREIRPESEARLRAAYSIVRLLAHFDAPTTIRGWFLGMNPLLDDASPADLLRAGEVGRVRAAALAFAADG